MRFKSQRDFTNLIHLDVDNHHKKFTRYRTLSIKFFGGFIDSHGIFRKFDDFKNFKNF